MFSHKNLVTQRELREEIEKNTRAWVKGGEIKIGTALLLLLEYLGLELHATNKASITKKTKKQKGDK